MLQKSIIGLVCLSRVRLFPQVPELHTDFALVMPSIMWRTRKVMSGSTAVADMLNGLRKRVYSWRWRQVKVVKA